MAMPWEMDWGQQTSPQASPYRDAIAGIESAGSGDYGALGPVTRKGDRAYGRYQVMGANVGPWTEKYLGRRMTPQEFLADQEAQDRVFDGEFGSYVEKYGPQGASRAWFAGEGGMNKPNRRDGLGTSVAEYERKFAGNLPQQAPIDPSGPKLGAVGGQMPWEMDWGVENKQETPEPSMAVSGGVTEIAKGDEPKQIQAGMQASVPQSDMATGVARSAGQGASFAFGDEAEAAARALAAKTQGDDRSWSEIYTSELETVRGELKEFQQENPGTAVAAELGGAIAPIALTRGKAGLPSSLPKVMGRGAAEGAGIGGLYGFGSGEGFEDRANRALEGATFGSVLGAATPLALKGVQQVGNAVLGPAYRAVRGAISPEAEASRRVGKAISKDVGEGLTEQQAARATQVTGQPIANIDRGGETTRAVARSAANTSPEARAVLNKTIDDRFEGQQGRITSWLQNKTGVSGDASATRDTLLDQARKANRPAYAAAYKAGDRPLQSPELQRLMEAPEVQKAAQEALKRGKSRAVAERMPWNPNARNLQFWDYVKRELDSMSSVAGRQGDKGGSQVVGTLARDLRDELDRLVPEFGPARAGAAKAFGADNALEAGQKFIGSNVDVPAARRALSKMSSAEKSLFQEGFVSSLMDRANKSRDRADVVRQIWGNQKSRDQIAVALGPQKAKEFEAFMAIEAIMDRARGAVQGNSTTVRQLAEMGLAGGATGVYTGDPLTGITTALAYGAGRKGLAKVDERVSKRVGEMLASDDPAQFQRALKTISKNSAMMASLRSYITAMASLTAAQQAGGGTESPQ